MKWRIVSGPRTFDKLDGRDIDVGWAYDVKRDGDRRTVSVYVAAGRGAESLPDECQRAKRTRGRSAVDSVLDRGEPPRYIVLTTAGLSFQ